MLQDLASDVLYGVLKGATYEETIGATKDRFGDQHLAAGYRDHLKTGTQIFGEPLQGFSTTIEQVTPSAFPSPHDHIHREPGKAFVEGLRD
jgi:hypothetical protein